MLHLKLFWSFAQIGLFSFGGGYAAIPIIQKQVVDLHHWLTLKEFMDIIAISQMTPGPVAINTATFVGMRILSLPGAVIATLGCVVPSFLIVLTIAYFYSRYKNLWVMQGILAGLRPATIALIATAGLGILSMAIFNVEIDALSLKSLVSFDTPAAITFVLALYLLIRHRFDPIYVILGSGILGMVVALFR
ncbi:MAG TPA: chromate transporter [Peptococcaceae bacterium]|nr:chromate transporter [Peptococcaceae bacterium]